MAERTMFALFTYTQRNHLIKNLKSAAKSTRNEFQKHDHILHRFECQTIRTKIRLFYAFQLNDLAHKHYFIFYARRTTISIGFFFFKSTSSSKTNRDRKEITNANQQSNDTTHVSDFFSTESSERERARARASARERARGRLWSQFRSFERNKKNKSQISIDTDCHTTNWFNLNSQISGIFVVVVVVVVVARLHKMIMCAAPNVSHNCEHEKWPPAHHMLNAMRLF